MQAFWLATVSNVCLLLAAFFTGPLSHIFGRQPIMLVSMGFYLPALVLCGVAKNFGTIATGRCIIGFGGGVVALSEICITDMVPLRERGRFMSYIMIPWVIGNSVGPIVAGVLADTISWRWAF